MVIITIDRNNCVSCGTCWESCPGFFEQSPDDTFSRIVEQYRQDGQIGRGKPPAGSEECARDAADLCPAQVITAEEE